MASVAELQARLDRIEAAYHSGALSLRDPDGAFVTYRSDAEMRAAIADLKQRIAAASGPVASPVIQVIADKGV